MSGGHYVILGSRGLLAAAGADARAFLQGMVSNDMDKLAPERALGRARGRGRGGQGAPRVRGGAAR
jgi:folate-binding Fe-S cluster repair protein YgfZ